MHLPLPRLREIKTHGFIHLFPALPAPKHVPILNSKSVGKNKVFGLDSRFFPYFPERGSEAFLTFIKFPFGKIPVPSEEE